MITIEFDSQLAADGMDLQISTLEIFGFKLIKQQYNLTELITPISETIQKQYTIENIKSNPIIAAYRSFYWQYLNIDPTKTRPASEALIRRILSQKSIPIISALVDAYNWASIQSLVSLGAYNLDKLQLPIQIRYSKSSDQFHPIGKAPLTLPSKILVTADNNDIIMCQYPYRDSELTMIDDHSSHIAILAYGVNKIPQDALKLAIELCIKNIKWLQKQNIASYRDMIQQDFHF